MTHVVVCWLKSPGDDEGRRRLVEVSKTLEGIPGVVSVAAGRVLPSDRPIVVSDFDVAIVLTFESEQAMRAYLEHPDHKRAVQETLKPLVERYVVYDFVVE